MLVHWDDVEPIAIDAGDLRGTRWRLGAAAGATRTGLSRYRLGPSERAMPVHVHGDEEELLYVLAGAGRYGSGSETGVTWLPRARAWWLEPRWLPADGPDPFAAEAAAGPLELPEPEAERPPTIVALAGGELGERRRGDVSSLRRDLGDVLGSTRIGVGHLVVEPGKLTYPPHCHSAEEELFVVLEGGGTLLLGEDEYPVRPGSVAARPPATGVAHAFRAGEDGLTLLAFGTREPNDITYYPRSRKVSLRGIGARFRIEPVDYWDGEEG